MRISFLVLVASLAAERVLACSCFGGGMAVVQPNPGATNVDRRAAIIAVAQSAAGDAQLTVTLDDGTVLPFEVEILRTRTGAESLVIARPQPEWPADTSLVITTQNFGARSSFVVRTGADSTELAAPDPPLVPEGGVVIEGFFNELNTCGPQFFSGTISFAGEGFLIRAIGDAASGDAPADGEASGFGAELSDSACSSSDLPRPLTFGATVRARFAIIDANGAVSRWSGPIEFTMPDDRDCDGIGDSLDACPDQPGSPDGVAAAMGCDGEPRFRCAPDGGLCAVDASSLAPECSEAAGCASSALGFPFFLLFFSVRRRLRH